MKTDKSKQFDDPVFVLGAGPPNGMGVVRCFGRRGIPVYVMDSHRLEAHRWSRYGKVLRCPPADLEDEALADFLLAHAHQQSVPPVLIATNDQTALYSLRYRDRLEPHIRFTFSRLEVAQRIIDKAEFSMAAREAGVDQPTTFIPTSLDEATQAADKIGYPCILKPANSTFFASKFQRKNFLVHSSRQLAEYWRLVEPVGLRMIVQDIIPGRQIYMWYGYYDKSSRLVAHFGYHKTRQNPPDFGCGSLVTAATKPDLIEAADRILRHVGYHGIVEPEFKFDPRDGRWKILEINARTSTQTRFSAAVGLDMEYLAYLEALGQPLTVPEVDGTGLLWTDTVGDFASAFSDPAMTLRKWLASRRGRKIRSLFAWDDPLPAIRLLPSITKCIIATLLIRWAPKLYERLRRKKPGEVKT